MFSTLAGRTSALRAMPVDVVAKADQISRDEARRLKMSRDETILMEPRQGGRIRSVVTLATPTLASAYSISRAVKIPVMCSSGLSSVTAPMPITAGASGVGVGSAINKLNDVVAMIAEVRSIADSLGISSDRQTVVEEKALTLYTYRMGHLLSDGSYVWSKMYSFKSSPYPGQDSLQRVIIFSDMGKAERDGSNEYNNYQPGSLKTTDQLIKDLNNIDIIFHIGDTTYANGYISQWDQFTSHCINCTIYGCNVGTGSFYDTQDSGGECSMLAETMFYVPAENRAKFWYSADYGMFHFCIADTEHDWREGSEQYRFIEHCLASADRQKQPWLIFAAHRVLGYSSDKWYGLEGLFEQPMGRESLQRLRQKYKVDIAFFGHAHNYERSCPIYQNQCVNPEKSHYSGTMNGTIHVVAGGAGSHLSECSQITPSWSLYRDYDFGFAKLTAFSHSSLLFEYKKSRDGNVYDSFTISRDYRDVYA
ncbi:hypothetical protein RHGRI_024573 [Rhododendron griersonianum]|uniref:Purple acid phosphatase n=1 Tax=Rhododendron griersonianum TaxID=479676 RepID=A0AAV6JF48_9ERIC|nr:hypothetical protein RHGRI_024573 [Rhododendron griersonianum]